MNTSAQIYTSQPDHPFDSLLADLHLPGHRVVAQHWLDLYSQQQTIPRLSDIDPLCFVQALPDVWIVDATDAGRFRIRLMGETLVEWYGRNPKGLCYDDIFTPAMLPLVTQQSRRIIDQPCIGYHRMHTTIPDWTKPADFERVAFPLRRADGSIGHILGVTVFNDGALFGRGGATTHVDADSWYDIPSASMPPSAR